MLARRTFLSESERREASAAVVSELNRHARLKGLQPVLGYMALTGEIDPADFLLGLVRAGGQVLVPRCRDDEPGELDLACVSCLEDFARLRPGRYGILEPAAKDCRPPGDFAPALILVPGVAFDPSGGRLGFGGGYYDRLLSRPGYGRALKAGLAHAFQVVDHVPRQPHDLGVDLVVTPGGVIEAVGAPR